MPQVNTCPLVPTGVKCSKAVQLINSIDFIGKQSFPLTSTPNNTYPINPLQKGNAHIPVTK